MLNSTKTWQDEFDNIFGENHHKICIGKNCECHKVVKQFISDLRKKDEEELIRIINNSYWANKDSEDYQRKLGLINKLKQYYETNTK